MEIFLDPEIVKMVRFLDPEISKMVDRSYIVESWVVKFWYDRLVFTLGGVGYKFGLSLWW